MRKIVVFMSILLLFVRKKQVQAVWAASFALAAQWTMVLTKEDILRLTEYKHGENVRVLLPDGEAA